jgi:hypothetical protein
MNIGKRESGDRLKQHSLARPQNGSRQQAAGSRQQTATSSKQTTGRYGTQQTAECRHQTADSRFHRAARWTSVKYIAVPVGRAKKGNSV